MSEGPAPTGRLDRLHRGYVLDLDGTVYLGDAILPGAQETIAELRQRGARIAFLTNKPLDRPAAYAAQLTSLGVPAGADDVISSIDALLRYLRTHPPGRAILPVTEPLLEEVLLDAGYRVTNVPEEADLVVVSWDRTFDYAKLERAFRAVRQGARIVATNPDAYCPTPDGGLPDCAAMLAAIEASTGSRAEAIVGKPSAHMAATLLERLDLPAKSVLMVGDRLETDVRMARQAGMTSALVLTGATSRSDLSTSLDRPDFVLTDLTELLPLSSRRPA